MPANKFNPPALHYSRWTGLLSQMIGLLAVLTILLLAPSCFAQTQEDGWIKGTGVTFQTLDKITARIATLETELEKSVRFGTLEITAFHCAYRPPEAPPETAAFIVIKDIGYAPAGHQKQGTGTPDEAKDIVFSGWMFASSPAISGLEHAVYDVTLLACLK